MTADAWANVFNVSMIVSVIVIIIAGLTGLLAWAFGRIVERMKPKPRQHKILPALPSQLWTEQKMNDPMSETPTAIPDNATSMSPLEKRIYDCLMAHEDKITDGYDLYTGLDKFVDPIPTIVDIAKEIADLIAVSPKDKEFVQSDALAFYANPNSYVTPSTGFAAQYDPTPSPVMFDKGARARAALKVIE